MPRIALTKGRLLAPSLEWLAESGFPAQGDPGRALSLELGGGWEAVLLKGPDVRTFVQEGAADLGVVGLDLLEEEAPDLYDLRALGFGRCRLCVAAPPGWSAPADRPVRVATKFPRLASEGLARMGLWSRVVPLASSVELAPQLGLADVIVDLVDSGRTLRDNGLEEVRVLREVEAHLVANRGAYRYLEPWWERLPSARGATAPQ